ncbi:MAG: DUF5916 domain-containing protein [Candidatus Latescibacterota bacterium]
MRAFLGLLLVAMACPVAAQDKVVHLHTAGAPIRVDGEMEPAWAGADSVADFVQQTPFHHQPPSHRTVARVLTTDDALYCLITCADDRGQVQARTGQLDQTSGDIVSIMLDTFGDRQTAYKFAVSAGGVRADCRLLDDARNRDYSWDGVWFAAARVTDQGFTVEMRIPYRSIQYDTSLDTWGLDFDRWKPATGEDLYWCAYAQNEGQRISRFGRLELGGLRAADPGVGLEIYPVGLLRAAHLADPHRDLGSDGGLDVFYNPSQRLTFQLTANPDFAQIEADPYQFNITRYETRYDERRPFFTQGNEVFRASGQERTSGFYQPLELFYSRRIGRQLPDGGEVPLRLGARAFGRAGGWEYGGFVAGTGETAFVAGAQRRTEAGALYAAARAKRTVLGNSSVGLLVAGKHGGRDNGVLDVDGALRGSSWQLAYQVARSFREGGKADLAASAGLRLTRPRYTVSGRGRTIGRDFDVGDVGFVPWQGLSDVVVTGGPRWYFPQGRLREVALYAGGQATRERADAYTDRAALLGASAQFRPLWGAEVTLQRGRSRDAGAEYTATRLEAASWLLSGDLEAQAWGGVSRTYNYGRMYRGLYSWAGAFADWQMTDVLQAGGTLSAFVENDPDGRLEEVTWNARPRLTLTPANDVTFYLYVDNLLLHSTGRLEQVIGGALFSWQFLPKSWAYLAINEVQARPAPGRSGPRPLRAQGRAAVLKAKVLYYL